MCVCICLCMCMRERRERDSMKENSYQTTLFSNNFKSLYISRPFLRGFCISSFTLLLSIWTSSHRHTGFTVPKQNALSFSQINPYCCTLYCNYSIILIQSPKLEIMSSLFPCSFNFLFNMSHLRA